MHVPREVAEGGVAAARTTNADGLVAVGGGSAIGLAKAIARDTGLPIVAVPTTYSGSGGDADLGPVGRRPQADRARLESSAAHHRLRPGPDDEAAAGGERGERHERHRPLRGGIWVPERTPVSVALAMEALRRFGRHLPRVVKDGSDAEARGECLIAAWLAGTVLTTGTGLHHKLAHALGGLGLPHAETHAIVLPHVTRFNLATAPEAQDRLADALQAKDPAAACSPWCKAFPFRSGCGTLGSTRPEFPTWRARPPPSASRSRGRSRSRTRPKFFGGLLTIMLDREDASQTGPLLLSSSPRNSRRTAMKLHRWLRASFRRCHRCCCKRRRPSPRPRRIGDPPEASNMRLVGYSDLQARSAYQPTIHKQGDRYIAYIGHHGGTPDIPKPINQADRSAGVQRHLDRRRHRSGASRNTSSISPVSKGTTRRAAPRWCGCATASSAEGRSEQILHAARVRRPGARDLGRDRSGEPGAARAPRGPARHPQELVGVRHRHRLPRLRRAGLAHAAHDADLRPRRPGAPGEDPRLRPARAGAGHDRHRADRTARADLDRPAGQPRLFRLRHQQGRHPADHRPREAA